MDIDTLDLITVNKLFDYVKSVTRRPRNRHSAASRPKEVVPTETKKIDLNPLDGQYRINELERTLAMMEGRPDKAQIVKKSGVLNLAGEVAGAADLDVERGYSSDGSSVASGSNSDSEQD